MRKKMFRKNNSWNLSSIVKNINSPTQETKWIPRRINTMKITNKHIIIRFLKTKDEEKILKATRAKQQNKYRETTTQMTAIFPSEHRITL